MTDELNLKELDYLYNECMKYLDGEDAKNASEYLDRFCALYLQSCFIVAGEISKLEDQLGKVSEEEKPIFKNLIGKLRKDYAFLNQNLSELTKTQQETGLTNAPTE
jgi:hypothetical protein